MLSVGCCLSSLVRRFLCCCRDRRHQSTKCIVFLCVCLSGTFVFIDSFLLLPYIPYIPYILVCMYGMHGMHGMWYVWYVCMVCMYGMYVWYVCMYVWYG